MASITVSSNNDLITLVNDPRPARKRQKHNNKPLGILLVLGGLLLLGLISQKTGPTRQPWVWEDFHKTQGTYLGYYFQKGQRYISVTTDAGLLTVAVDPQVRFRYMPTPGSRVEVSYVEPSRPRLVDSRDLRVILVPDPDRPSHGTQY